MRIHEFVWPQDRIDHIARHGVLPHEVEEVCSGEALVQRGRSEGPSPVYYGSGYLPAADFWKLGAVFGLVFFGLFLILAVPWVLTVI